MYYITQTQPNAAEWQQDFCLLLPRLLDPAVSREHVLI